MRTHPPSDRKKHVLKKQGTLNPRGGDVEDSLFQDSDFFDARDLVQVKYEMLRRVSKDGYSIKEASARFACSRQSYYKAKKDFDDEGLSGLVPRKRGPHGGHKLTDTVLDFVEQLRIEDKTLNGSALTQHVRERFGIEIYPSSIERALVRRQKKRQ